MNTIMDVYSSCAKSHKLGREEIHLKFLNVSANVVYQTSKIKDQKNIWIRSIKSKKRKGQGKRNEIWWFCSQKYAHLS